MGKYTEMSDDELRNLSEEEKGDALLELINSMGPLINSISKDMEEYSNNKFILEDLDKADKIELCAPCLLNRSNCSVFSRKPATVNLCNSYNISQKDISNLIKSQQDDLSFYIDRDNEDKVMLIQEELVVRRNRYYIKFAIYLKENVDIEILKDFIKSQCSDGWGEGLEQHFFPSFVTPNRNNL